MSIFVGENQITSAVVGCWRDTAVITAAAVDALGPDYVIVLSVKILLLDLTSYVFVENGETSCMVVLLIAI